MKKQLLAFIGILFCLTAISLTVWADSRTYKPPPKKGTIYVVVRFKPYNSRDLYPKTTVKVKWGSYSNSKQYGTATTIRTVGVVIALRHTKDDSVPLTVETDGTILSIRQSDSPPSEVNSGNYQKDNW